MARLTLAYVGALCLLLLALVQAKGLEATGRKATLHQRSSAQLSPPHEDDTTSERVEEILDAVVVPKAEAPEEEEQTAEKPESGKKRISKKHLEYVREQLGDLSKLNLDNKPARGGRRAVDDLEGFVRRKKEDESWGKRARTDDLGDSIISRGKLGQDYVNHDCGVPVTAGDFKEWKDVKPDGTPCVPNGRCMTTESIVDDPHSPEALTVENHRCVNVRVYEALKPLRDAVQDGKEGVWKHVSAKELLMDMGEKIFVSGYNMKQNRRNICGPLTVVNAMIRSNPVRWAHTIVKLYFDGEANIEFMSQADGTGKVVTKDYLMKPRPYVFDLDPRSVTKFGKKASSLTHNPQLADWVLTVSMRDSRTLFVMHHFVNDGKEEEDEIQDTLSLMKGGDFAVGDQTDTLSTSNDLLFWCSHLFFAHCSIFSEDRGAHLKFLKDVTPSALLGIERGAQMALGAMMTGSGNPIEAGKQGVSMALTGATPSFVDHVKAKFTPQFVQAIGSFARKASIDTIKKACETLDHLDSFLFAQVEATLLEHWGSKRQEIEDIKAKRSACMNEKSTLTWDARVAKCASSGEDKEIRDRYRRRRKVEERLINGEEISDEEQEFMDSESLNQPTCPDKGESCLPNHWVGIIQCPSRDFYRDSFKVWSWGQTFTISTWELHQMAAVFIAGRSYKSLSRTERAALPGVERLHIVKQY